MEWLVVVAVVGVLGGLVAAGVATGNAGNPTTITLPGDAKSPADCAQACAAWDNARQMQCNAKADEAAARSRSDAIRGQMLALIAAAVALAAAGGAAIAAIAAASGTIIGIPIAAWLLGIAIGLFIAAAAAAAAAAVLAGQLVAADADAGRKASARMAWDTEVAMDRTKVSASCSLAEANACFSRTAPC